MLGCLTINQEPQRSKWNKSAKAQMDITSLCSTRIPITIIKISCIYLSILPQNSCLGISISSFPSMSVKLDQVVLSRQLLVFSTLYFR